MIDKPFDDIEAADINALVERQEQESRTIEFKRELPGGKESDRKEFLGDVSSFANALGGDLLYGIDAKAGRAERVTGVMAANAEAEVLRLDSMIRDGIRPRIIGCRVRVVSGLGSGFVFLIRIPRSLNGPHIVSYQQDFRFYSRSPAGKFRMDVSDIRDAVLNSTTVAERARALRAERLGRIAAGETPVPLEGSRLVIVHVLPHASLASGERIELKRGIEESGALSPFYTRGYSAPRFNLDGVYTYAPSSERNRNHSYLQLFRTGILETVDASLMSSRSEEFPAGFPSGAFADALFRFAVQSLNLYTALGVGFPLTFMVSLSDVKGLPLYVSSRLSIYMSQLSFDRHVVPLPELVLEEKPEDVRTAVRPLLDALWQAAGAERCLDYHESGGWQPTW